MLGQIMFAASTGLLQPMRVAFVEDSSKRSLVHSFLALACFCAIALMQSLLKPSGPLPSALTILMHMMLMSAVQIISSPAF
jgi:hypothetical protein